MEKKQTVSKHKLLSYPSVSSDKLLKNTFTVSVYIGMTLVVCALACGAAVLALLVARRYYCHRKQKLAGEFLYRFCVGSVTFICMWQVPMQGMWCMMRLFFLLLLLLLLYCHSN